MAKVKKSILEQIREADAEYDQTMEAAAKKRAAALEGKLKDAEEDLILELTASRDSLKIFPEDYRWSKETKKIIKSICVTLGVDQNTATSSSTRVPKEKRLEVLKSFVAKIKQDGSGRTTKAGTWLTTDLNDYAKEKGVESGTASVEQFFNLKQHTNLVVNTKEKTGTSYIWKIVE